MRSRICFLTGAATIFAVLLGAQTASACHTAFTSPLPAPAVLTGSDITLTAAESDVPICPGTPTRMWTYNGTFPGPTIRRPTGKQTESSSSTGFRPLPGADAAQPRQSLDVGERRAAG